METRAIVAIVLSMLVIFLYQYFLMPTAPKQPEEEKALTEGERKTDTGEQGLVPVEEKPKQGVQEQGATPLILALLPSESLRRIPVDTGITKVVLINQGGLIEQVQLSRYLTKDKGMPIDLLTGKKGGELPASLIFGDPQLTNTINNALFETSQKALQLSPVQPTGQVTFSYQHPSGLRITKEYHFQYGSYGIDMAVQIESPVTRRLNSYRLFWGPSIYDDSDDQSGYATTGPIGSIDGKLVLDKPDTAGTEKILAGRVQWIALQSKYFVAALLPKPEEKIDRAVVALNQSQEYLVGLEHPLGVEGGKALYTLYAGPKEGERLETYGPSGARLSAILDYDYGWFAFVAKPLLKVLQFFYRFTHNYGIAIILLTGVIKILFFPLTHKSFKSMQDMQKIQPQMKALQERFKHDKQKLNQEMMRLYRENRVNPLSGCLPMVLQIPIFFALYKVLYVSIELRQAPFFLWITDLSAKDPYYILPILMGASMVIQQKMTPTVGDPTQAKIMLLMPVFFTFLFLNFPVGLVIYWLVNNLLTIGQQYLLQRNVTTPPVTVTE
jgi:YidC/Oxa1 family membrane protein insertase